MLTRQTIYAWKMTEYQSKPYDGKWTHAPEEDPEDRD